MPAPPVARVLCGVGAALAAWFLLFVSPRNLVLDAHPWAALVTILVSLPFVAFLGAIALAPRPLQALLSRHSALDLSKGRHVGAAVLLASTLAFVLGLGSLVGGAYSLEAALAGEERPPTDAGALWANLVTNLVVFIVPVVAYVCLVHDVGLADALPRLGLRREHVLRDLLVGAGVALALLFALLVLSVALVTLGIEMPENEVALDIARDVTIAGALGIALVTGLSEEIFFRGFLQPRVGLLAQAVLFALAHLSYVHAFEIVATLSLGLVFGLLLRRTGSVWGPIGGHFTWNFVMLVSVLAADALGLAFPGGR